MSRPPGEPEVELLELYVRPVSGPLVEVYARIEQERERARTEAEARARAELEEQAENFKRTTELRRDWQPKTQPVMHRMRGDGFPLCAEHAKSLIEFGFCIEADLRPVWDDEKILQVAQTTGQNVDDLHALHGQFFCQDCGMCGRMPVVGVRCHNDRCKKPLPPQWPAMYCSNNCAIDDA